jgi:hypothetical protein
MKKILYSVLFIVGLLVADVASAQSRTSYFMEGSYFRTELNPALVPTRGYVAVPFLSGVGINLNSNYLSVDNLFYQRGGQIVTAFNGAVSPSEFLDRLPNRGIVHNKEDITILGGGFFHKIRETNVFWNFGIGAHISVSNTESKDLFTALKTLGNNHYNLGDTYLGGTVYLDLYVGAAVPITDWLNVGAKAKFLIGILDLGVEFDELSAKVDVSKVTGTLRGNWRANGIFTENKYIVDGKYKGDPLSLSNLGNAKSYGFAVDLGAEVRFFDDHLKASIGVTDLGFIKWAKSTHIGGKLNGDFEFEGVDVESGDFVKPVGDIDTDNIVGLKSYDGYTTMVNCALNVGVEYNILKNRISFGLLSHTQFLTKAVYSELTISANFRPLNWLSASISHTFLNHNKFGIFGAAINFHPKGLNLFIGMDFIDCNMVKYEAFSIPRYAKSMNVYFGLGFSIGKHQRLQKHYAQSENLAE